MSVFSMFYLACLCFVCLIWSVCVLHVSSRMSVFCVSYFECLFSVCYLVCLHSLGCLHSLCVVLDICVLCVFSGICVFCQLPIPGMVHVACSSHARIMGEVSMNHSPSSFSFVLCLFVCLSGDNLVCANSTV